MLEFLYNFQHNPQYTFVYVPENYQQNSSKIEFKHYELLWYLLYFLSHLFTRVGKQVVSLVLKRHVKAAKCLRHFAAATDVFPPQF